MVSLKLKVLAKFGLCSNCSQKLHGCSLAHACKILQLLACSFKCARLREISLVLLYCWRTQARQLPILYNKEKKAKSVGCKIGDLRSKFGFYIRGLLYVQTCAVDYGCFCTDSKDRIKEVSFYIYVVYSFF